ncbi:MAG: precorrin-8X methylmutase [Clostridium sp.]|uniref:precorrin-8X methylmutase n=1 Tax=Clostridium sp. TaxID=1506 RepID=UPI002FCB3EA7
MYLNILSPSDIEERSFQIIESEMGEVNIKKEFLPILKRVIHTSADFDYIDNMYFSDDAVEKFVEVIKSGGKIITDTEMVRSGINKKVLKKYGAEALCFMGDEDVAKEARERGITRAIVSMEKASKLNCPLVFAIGNAPTALIKLREMMDKGLVKPYLIIAVPVGFVNVVESKELIIDSGVSCISARGRKGGSTIAAAICNAMLYSNC